MYKVVMQFNERFDEDRLYAVGDDYPRDGFEPTAERIKELSDGSNRVGVVFIKAVPKKAKKEAVSASTEKEPETAE